MQLKITARRYNFWHLDKRGVTSEAGYGVGIDFFAHNLAALIRFGHAWQENVQHRI